MKELELRRWLNRAFYADKKAKALDMLVQQCRERATGLVRATEGNDKGRSSTSKNGTENALIQLAEMEDKAEKLSAEAVKITAEIWEAIIGLHDDDLEAVLINRYILFQTVEQTAESMGYDPRTVMRKIKKAIEKLSPNVIECHPIDVL